MREDYEVVEIDEQLFQTVSQEYNQSKNELDKVISKINEAFQYISGELASSFSCNEVLGDAKDIRNELTGLSLRINAALMAYKKLDEDCTLMLDTMDPLIENLFQTELGEVDGKTYEEMSIEEKQKYLEDLVITYQNALDLVKQEFEELYGEGIQISLNDFLELDTIFSSFHLYETSGFASQVDFLGNYHSGKEEGTLALEPRNLAIMLSWCHDTGALEKVFSYIDGKSWEESGLSELYFRENYPLWTEQNVMDSVYEEVYFNNEDYEIDSPESLRTYFQDKSGNAREIYEKMYETTCDYSEKMQDIMVLSSEIYNLHESVELLPYQELMNEVMAREDFQAYLGKNYSNYDLISSVNLQGMSQEEVAFYDYLYEQDSENATKYLEAMQDTINQRVGYQKAASYIDELTENGFDVTDIWSSFFEGGKDGVKTFCEGIKNFVSPDGKRSIDEYERMYKVSLLLESNEQLQQDYGIDVEQVFTGSERNFLNWNYQTGSSVGNMLIPSLMNFVPVVGKGLASGLMTVSIAGNSTEEALQEGHGSFEARLYGLLTGLSESTTERLLGGIPGVSNLEKSFFGNMLSEGFEEFTQEYLDAVVRNAILGENNDLFSMQLLSQAVEALANGSITSGILQGVNSGVSTTLNTGVSLATLGTTDYTTILNQMESRFRTKAAETAIENYLQEMENSDGPSYFARYRLNHSIHYATAVELDEAMSNFTSEQMESLKEGQGVDAHSKNLLNVSSIVGNIREGNVSSSETEQANLSMLDETVTRDGRSLGDYIIDTNIDFITPEALTSISQLDSRLASNLQRKVAEKLESLKQEYEQEQESIQRVTEENDLLLLESETSKETTKGANPTIPSVQEITLSDGVIASSVNPASALKRNIETLEGKSSTDNHTRILNVEETTLNDDSLSVSDTPTLRTDGMNRPFSSQDATERMRTTIPSVQEITLSDGVVTSSVNPASVLKRNIETLHANSDETISTHTTQSKNSSLLQINNTLKSAIPFITQKISQIGEKISQIQSVTKSLDSKETTDADSTMETVMQENVSNRPIDTISASKESTSNSTFDPVEKEHMVSKLRDTLVEHGSDTEAVDAYVKAFESTDTQAAFDILQTVLKVTQTSGFNSHEFTVSTDDKENSCWHTDGNRIQILNSHLGLHRAIFHETAHFLFDSVFGIQNDYSSGRYRQIDFDKVISNIEDVFEKARENASRSGILQATITDQNNQQQKMYNQISAQVREQHVNNNDRTSSLLGEGNHSPSDYESFSLAAEIQRQALKYIEEHTYIPEFQDIADAVFLGEETDLDRRPLKILWRHGEKYYQASKKATIHEIVANYTSAKVLNKTEFFEKIREVFGEEFYQTIDSIYQQMMDYGSGKLNGISSQSFEESSLIELANLLSNLTIAQQNYTRDQLDDVIKLKYDKADRISRVMKDEFPVLESNSILYVSSFLNEVVTKDGKTLEDYLKETSPSLLERIRGIARITGNDIQNLSIVELANQIKKLSPEGIKELWQNCSLYHGREAERRCKIAEFINEVRLGHIDNSISLFNPSDLNEIVTEDGKTLKQYLQEENPSMLSILSNEAKITKMDIQNLSIMSLEELISHLSVDQKDYFYNQLYYQLNDSWKEKCDKAIRMQKLKNGDLSVLGSRSATNIRSVLNEIVTSDNETLEDYLWKSNYQLVDSIYNYVRITLVDIRNLSIVELADQISRLSPDGKLALQECCDKFFDKEAVRRCKIAEFICEFRKGHIDHCLATFDESYLSEVVDREGETLLEYMKRKNSLLFSELESHFH